MPPTLPTHQLLPPQGSDRPGGLQLTRRRWAQWRRKHCHRTAKWAQLGDRTATTETCTLSFGIWLFILRAVCAIEGFTHLHM